MYWTGKKQKFYDSKIHLVYTFGQCAFGIFTNAADSIKLGGDVVFYSRYNAKSKWRRYCDEIEACTEQYTRGGIIIRQLG